MESRHHPMAGLRCSASTVWSQARCGTHQPAWPGKQTATGSPFLCPCFCICALVSADSGWRPQTQQVRSMRGGNDCGALLRARHSSWTNVWGDLTCAWKHQKGKLETNLSWKWFLAVVWKQLLLSAMIMIFFSKNQKGWVLLGACKDPAFSWKKKGTRLL